MLKTIIVDDESVIRQGIKQLIKWEELGFTIVDEATDGLDALNKLQSQYFHLMITDISMPHMNGLELIKQARALNTELKIIVLSGFNEFDFVKEAMKYAVDNYLLKPIEEQELIETLLTIKESIATKIEHHYLGSENSQILTNHLMNRLIKNKISAIDFRNRASFLNITIPDAPYYIAVIELDGLAAKYEEDPDSVELAIFFACFNVTQELLANRGISSILFEDEQHRIVCLFEKNCVAIPAEEIAEEILIAFQTYVKETITIALSQEIYSLSSIHTIYTGVIHLLDYTFFLGTNVIITSHSIPTITHVSINEEELLTNYERAIRSCNPEETSALIASLFEQMVQHAMPSRSYVEFITMKLIVKSIEIVKEYNGSLSFLYDDKTSLSQQLISLNSLDAIAQHIINIAKHTIHTIEHLQHNRPIKIVEQVCQYIDQHYAEEIKLKELGDIYFINPSYLGKLFRKDKGESFNDYLNKVRLNQAKHLLKTSNQRIYQIADAVGYKDYNYFCKIFKQHFGVLPSNIK